MASEKSERGGATDPLRMWRDWVDQAERQWNAVLNEVMASEQFGQASSKVMEALLGVQASMNEATQRYLTTLNLPTRTDVLSLADRLAAIEQQLERIEAKVSGLGPEPASPPPAGGPGPKPRRTKKAAPSPKKAASAGKKKAAPSPKKAASAGKKKAATGRRKARKTS